MNRRRFLKVSAITAGSLAIGGGAIYSITRDSDILDDHFAGTEKVLVTRFGKGRSTGLIEGHSTGV
jgi:hypothetical protein